MKRKMKKIILSRSKIIAVVGPTASGKTAVSLALAKALNAEIISFDSLQIYKYLNIGTAKPTREERRQVKHHLINICAPNEEFNAGTFEKLAREKIKELERKGKTVILAGGTGLYLKALADGLCPAPPANQQLRQKLTRLGAKYGPAYLYRRLLKVDPGAAQKTHPHNLPRIIRALEVFTLTGKTLSQFQHETTKSELKITYFGLAWDREKLYERINQRVESMFAKGLIKEVKTIVKRGYAPNLKPLQSIGYRQVYQYLQGKITLEQAIELTKRDTRHYAKRQLSWFRKIKGIHWLKISTLDIKALRKIVKYVRNKRGE